MDTERFGGMMKRYLTLAAIILIFCGCTGKMNIGSDTASILPSPGADSPPSLPDNSSPVISPDNTSPIAVPVVVATPAPLAQEFMKPEAAQAKVEEIVQTMNADPQYQINNDDFSFLKSEGLVGDQNDLKGWVK